MEWYGWWKVIFNQGYKDGQGLTDDFSYDTNDTEDICDYDGREPIYKYGTKVCNQFKFCKNGEHAVGTCPEGQYFDTVVGESFILWVKQISNFIFSCLLLHFYLAMWGTLCRLLRSQYTDTRTNDCWNYRTARYRWWSMCLAPNWSQSKKTYSWYLFGFQLLRWWKIPQRSMPRRTIFR